MKIKAGVDLAGIRTELLLGLFVADGVFKMKANRECTLTAIRDGKHKPGSKHYVGLAADLRTTTDGITITHATAIAEAMKAALGAQFDVVVEPDHIHLEFDPKEAIL